MKKLCLKALAIIVAMVFSLGITANTSTIANAKSDVSFSDIENHWAKNYIIKAVKSGLIKGYDDGSFKPNSPIKRCEFVYMITTLLKLKDENKIKLKFTDVTPGDWYYDCLQKAMYAKIISGTSTTKFSPNASITRQETATILGRILPYDTKSGNINTFTDAHKISSWAKNGVVQMIVSGYMTGTGNNKFEPSKALKRGEATKLMIKIMENEKIIRNDVKVEGNSDYLTNSIFVGDIYINITPEKNQTSSSINIKSITSMGQIYVDGESKSKLNIYNSHISKLAVCQNNGKLTISLNGYTSVYEAIVFNSNDLQEYHITGKGYIKTAFPRGNILFSDAVKIVKLANGYVASGIEFSNELLKECVMEITNAGYIL